MINVNPDGIAAKHLLVPEQGFQISFIINSYNIQLYFNLNIQLTLGAQVAPKQ